MSRLSIFVIVPFLLVGLVSGCGDQRSGVPGSPIGVPHILPVLSDSDIIEWDADFQAIHGSADGDLVITGDGGTIVTRRSGVWALESSGVNVPLFGVHHNADDDIWAVGPNRTIVHYDGTGWVIVCGGPIDGDTATESDSNTESDTDDPAIAALAALHPDTHFFGVWANSPSDVYVVGSGWTMVHWNGTLWSTNPASSGYGWYFDAWAPDSQKIFVVGTVGAGAISWWDADGWNQANACFPVDEDTDITADTGTETTSDGDTEANPDTETDSETDPPVNFDGICINFFGVWGTSGNNVYAVGDRGTIAHFGAGTGTLQTTGTTLNTLNDVWGSSDTDIWAVGNNGTVMHSNGSVWTLMFILIEHNLYGVFGTSATDVTMVGENNCLIHYDGADFDYSNCVEPANDDSDTNLDSDIDTNSSSDGDVDGDSDTNSDADSDTNSDADSDADGDSDSDSDADGDVDWTIDTSDEPGPDTDIYTGLHIFDDGDNPTNVDKGCATTSPGWPTISLLTFLLR